MNEDLKEYRAQLIQTTDKLNESYDKLIITLSGGALALSLTFLKDIITEKPTHLAVLYWSWGLLIGSLASVLGSLLFGIEAYKKAVKQVDANSIYEELAGGRYAILTTILHYLGTICLIAGLVCMSIFTTLNMEEKNVKRQSTTAAKEASASDEHSTSSNNSVTGTTR